jgi:hypothetical protein
MLAAAARKRNYAAIYRARLVANPGKTARDATGHRTTERKVTSSTAGRRTQSEIAARDRALDALNQMRRHGRSLTTASREARTTPDAVQRYAGAAIERRGSRWVAKPADRLLRRQYTAIIGPDGEPVEAPVETHSSHQASEVSKQNADRSTFGNARTSPPAKREARQRLLDRHGKPAGRRAQLPDGTVIDNPRFYGEPEGLEHLAVETDIADIDRGSDPPTGIS